MTAPRPCRPADMRVLAGLMAGPDPVHPLAGGTDMLIAGRALPDAGVLVDLSTLPGLRGIDSAAGDIRIGAATPVAEIEADRGLNWRFAALTQAAAECGSVQIRNRATLGGNIANAAAAADLVVPLMLAGARLEVIAPGGAHYNMSLADYRPGRGLLITAAILPGARLEPASAFVKLGPRRDLTLARLNMAAMARLADAHIMRLRLVAGALGPRPIVLTRAAAALEGKRPEPQAFRGFLDALGTEVDAAAAGRSSHPWKRQAIRGVGLDLIARLLGRSPRDELFDGVP